jgi:dTDP-4-dehydrorhamnose 3,5-epimerase
MNFEELAIKGVWLAHSPIHADSRGSFREWFKPAELLSATGQNFAVMQSNISISHRGVLRGIHFSLAEHGQGKWITCITGSIWDVVVDIRPSSPTFKQWVGIPLNSQSGHSVLVSEGLGHGFISLEDNTAVSYLLTSPYSPAEEHEISPLDSELSISWPIELLK